MGERSGSHGPVDALEILEVGELDRDPTLLGRHLYAHARVEVFCEEVFELDDSDDR